MKKANKLMYPPELLGLLAALRARADLVRKWVHIPSGLANDEAIRATRDKDAATIRDLGVAERALEDWLQERGLGLQDLLTLELRRHARREYNYIWDHPEIRMPNNARVTLDLGCAGDFVSRVSQAGSGRRSLRVGPGWLLKAVIKLALGGAQ